MVDFKSRLKNLGADWRQAKKREPGTGMGDDVPDGIYRMCLASASVGESMQSGNLKCSFAWVILEGEHRGKQIWESGALVSEDNLFYLQDKLAKLGCEIPDNPQELEGLLEEVSGRKPVVRAKVKDRDGWKTVYVNKLLEEESETDVSEMKKSKPAQAADVEEEIAPEEEPEDAPEPEEPEEPEESAVEPAEEPPAEVQEGKEVDLELGMKVAFHDSKGSVVVGEIKEWDGEDKCYVLADGKKRRTNVKIDSLMLPPEEEEPVEPEPEPEPVRRTVRRIRPA